MRPPPPSLIPDHARGPVPPFRHPRHLHWGPPLRPWRAAAAALTTITMAVTPIQTLTLIVEAVSVTRGMEAEVPYLILEMPHLSLRGLEAWI